MSIEEIQVSVQKLVNNANIKPDMSQSSDPFDRIRKIHEKQTTNNVTVASTFNLIIDNLKNVSSKIDDFKQEVSSKIDEQNQKIDDFKQEVSSKIDDFKQEVSSKIDEQNQKIDEQNQKIDDFKHEIFSKIDSSSNQINQQFSQLFEKLGHPEDKSKIDELETNCSQMEKEILILRNSMR